MARMNPSPQPAIESDAAVPGTWPEMAGRTMCDFESLSWLAPRVPLRQVICILGAGQDPLKEQFRLLHARLEDLRQTRPLKTILVTSSLPQEGKSFVALNLAVAVSQRGRNKVLLLEADLRQPSCCSALGLSPVPGLVECCGSSGLVAEFSYRVSRLDLCLLPAGERPAAAIELLPSQRISQIVAETSRGFDWVIVDSAPLLPVADSVVLSRLCDGILLVVHRKRALKTALLEALRRIEPQKLLGVVLNDFPAHHSCKSYFRSLPEPVSRTDLDAGNTREAA